MVFHCNYLDEVISSIKAILTVRAKDGATINEIKSDYFEFVSDELPFENRTQDQIENFLVNIPGVYVIKNGVHLYYINSENSKHIANMIENQNPPKQKNSMKMEHKPFHSSTKSCYFVDNYKYQKRQYSSAPNLLRQNKHNNKLNVSTNSIYSDILAQAAYFYNYQLVGDGFFLHLAVCDLQCSYVPDQRVRQSGLCISGQTIKDATQRIYKSSYVDDYVILNIGSVDLLQGRELIDMEYDFVELIKAFEFRGVIPIITTLAPLANIGHIPEHRQKLLRFNQFIKNHFRNVIDIHSCFVSNSGQTLYDCYQADVLYVSGSCHPHVFWNRIGRQRVIKYLKNKISDIIHNNHVVS